MNGFYSMILNWTTSLGMVACHGVRRSEDLLDCDFVVKAFDVNEPEFIFANLNNYRTQRIGATVGASLMYRGSSVSNPNMTVASPALRDFVASHGLYPYSSLSHHGPRAA